MPDTSCGDCCGDNVLSTTEDDIDIALVCVVLLTVVFVRIFDFLSDSLNYNINCLTIMGNLFSRLTGNCSATEDDDKSSRRSPHKCESTLEQNQSSNPLTIFLNNN